MLAFRREWAEDRSGSTPFHHHLFSRAAQGGRWGVEYTRPDGGDKRMSGWQNPTRSAIGAP